MIRNTRVQSVIKAGDGQAWDATLSDGKRMSAELYLLLHGIQVKISFAPEKLLDLRENVQKDKHLRLTGTGNIRVIGDVGNDEPKQLTVTDGQINHLASALHAA